ncbi:MAG: hypothetical protein ACOY3V_09920 [Pseudomonadota bacterium]
MAARDYGKPRPAVIVQSDFFNGHQSCTLLPLLASCHPPNCFALILRRRQRMGWKNYRRQWWKNYERVACAY